MMSATELAETALAVAPTTSAEERLSRIVVDSPSFEAASSDGRGAAGFRAKAKEVNTRMQRISRISVVRSQVLDRAEATDQSRRALSLSLAKS